MNIHQAAKFLKKGKRIRRSSWHPDGYLDEVAGLLNRYTMQEYHSIEKNKTTTHKYLSNWGCWLELEDLLAKDWEVKDD